MSNAHNRRRSRFIGEHGFSLPELMVCVTLVCVATAFATPVYKSSRTKANQRVAIQQIALMQITIQQYFNDYSQYPPDAVAAGVSGIKDPWGNSYVYRNIASDKHAEARAGRDLMPINSDYDLFSMGPNGMTKPRLDDPYSVDDVVRAKNGAFIGSSIDF